MDSGREPGPGGASWGASSSWTPLPTRASPRPTGTTRPSTAAAGRSTPRSPSYRIPPSAPNPLRTRTSPGLMTVSRNPGPPNRPTATSCGWTGRRALWRRSRRPSRTGACRHRADTAHQAEGLTSPERTDFWAKPATRPRPGRPSAPADLRRPLRRRGPRSRRSRGHPGPRPADTATTPARRNPRSRTAVPVPHRVARTQPRRSPHGVRSCSRSSSQPVSTAVPAQAAVGDQRCHRQDRFFPVRLLAVIVIAALIGSALVLLLK